MQSTQFTEDQKNQLISQGIAADQDFLFNIATGTYDYISDGADRIVQANSISDVLGTLDSMLEPTDAVLVKASHFMGLSRVVEGLIR